MKIAIISLHHVESSLCLAKYLAKRGHEVDYYFVSGWVSHLNTPGVIFHNQVRNFGIHKMTAYEVPELWNYTLDLPVTYYKISLFHFRRQFHWLNKLYLRFATNKIKSIGYDAIDIVGQSYGIDILHDMLRGENITHTLHEIGSHFDGTYKDPLVDAIVRDSGKTILHSYSLQQRLNQIDKDQKTTSAVIPFGMFETTLLYEEDVQLPFNLNKDATTLLFYGYISPYKGIDVLEAACKILNAKGIKYNIIIAGSGRNSSVEYFKEQPNAYVLNRFLTSNEIIKLHRVADVVVMPYKSASQSGIIPTSFLLGCPVIGTNVGAIPEVLSDGINGLICEPNNPQALASTMNLYICNADLRDKLEEGVKSFGHGDNFDWNVIAEQTEKFIK